MAYVPLDSIIIDVLVFQVDMGGECKEGRVINQMFFLAILT